MLWQRPNKIIRHAFSNEITVDLLRFGRRWKGGKYFFLPEKGELPHEMTRQQLYTETVIILKICYSLLHSLFAVGVIIFCDMHLNCPNFQDFGNLRYVSLSPAEARGTLQSLIMCWWAQPLPLCALFKFNAFHQTHLFSFLTIQYELRAVFESLAPLGLTCHSLTP